MGEFAIASLIMLYHERWYLFFIVFVIIIIILFYIYLIFTDFWLFLLISFELHPVIGMSMSNLLILSMVANKSNFCVRDVLHKLKSKKNVCCMNCLFLFISMNM